MERIGERLIGYYIPGTDIEIPGGGVNILTVLNTAFVMLALWGLMLLGARKLSVIPTRGQVLLEHNEVLIGGEHGH